MKYPNEVDKMLDDAKEQLERIKQMLSANQPVQPIESRWRAERGEQYWSVECDKLGIVPYRHDSGYDEELYELGNYFQTKEQAEAVATAIKSLLEYVHAPGNHFETKNAYDVSFEALEKARKAVQKGTSNE